MKKQFAVIAIMLLALVGCNKQQPTQVKNNVSSETSFSKWLGEGQRLDKGGNLRVPTLIVRSETDTTYLPFEKWGIAEKKLSKISGYTWEYTISVNNLNEDIGSSETFTLFIYPYFDAGSYDHLSMTEAYCYAYDLDTDVYFQQLRWRMTNFSANCYTADLVYIHGSVQTHTVSDNGFAWYPTVWSTTNSETYSGSCSPNSTHQMSIANLGDYGIVADDFKFHVTY